MNIKKSTFSLVLCIALILAMFSGCAQTANAPASSKAGQLISETMQYGGIDRMYQYYIPSAFKSDSKMPVVFTFHGMGSNSKGQLGITGMLTLAEKQGFILIAPNSTRALKDGTFVSDGKSYYDDTTLTAEDIQWNAGYPSKSNQAKIDDVGYVSTLIDKFVKDFNVDSKRIYATGMSNGGIFCNRLAIELSDKITAVGSVVGPLGVYEQSIEPKTPIKVVLIMSDKDPIVPYKGWDKVLLSADDTIKYWTSKYNIKGEAKITELPKKVQDDPTSIFKYEFTSSGSGQFVFYLVKGGGHAWPGGAQYLPVETIGIASQQINATEVLWNELKGITK